MRTQLVCRLPGLLVCVAHAVTLTLQLVALRDQALDLRSALVFVLSGERFPLARRERQHRQRFRVRQLRHGRPGLDFACQAHEVFGRPGTLSDLFQPRHPLTVSEQRLGVQHVLTELQQVLTCALDMNDRTLGDLFQGPRRSPLLRDRKCLCHFPFPFCAACPSSGSRQQLGSGDRVPCAPSGWAGRAQIRRAWDCPAAIRKESDSRRRQYAGPLRVVPPARSCPHRAAWLKMRPAAPGLVR